MCININYFTEETSRLKLEQYLSYYMTKLFSTYNEFEKYSKELIEKISKKKVY